MRHQLGVGHVRLPLEDRNFDDAAAAILRRAAQRSCKMRRIQLAN